MSRVGSYSANKKQRNEALRKWRAENPEKAREQWRKCRERNVEKVRKQCREWRLRFRERLAGRSAPSACEACGSSAETGRALAFDHDHLTGEFRGWLCYGCNLALGCVNDDIERLDALIVYLSRSRRPRLVVNGTTGATVE
jgi:hypothetical protein